MKLSVLLFILLCSTLMLCPLESHAGLPLYDEASRSYRLGQWQFDAQTSYYEATANYSRSGGEYVSLPNSASYHLTDLDFGVRWVPKSRWALYATSRLSFAESKNATDTRQDSSLTQVVLGTDFLLHSSKHWDLYPDLSVTVPLQRVDTTGDTVLNGEGATEFSGKMIARMKWGIFDPFAFVGFTFRDEDRASLLPYGLGAELQFSNWRLGGELRGYQTASQDKYHNNPAQRDVVAIRDGYALHYYSVDPTLLETNVWLRGNLGNSWAFKIGGGTSLTGSATSAGWTAFAGLSFSPQFSSSYAPTPIVAPYKDRSSEELQNFHEETSDGVDQNLFQKSPPPPPVKPAPAPQPVPQAPPPAAPAKPTSVQQKKNLQKELDQTEFQIELKSTKKKKKKKH